MKARTSRVMFSVPVVAVSLCAVATPRKALGQQQTVVERPFRSMLTSVTPLYASGQEGDPDAVVGLKTESTVFEIHLAAVSTSALKTPAVCPPGRGSGAKH